MAGSGVRAMRVLLEVQPAPLVYIADASRPAVDLIRRNLERAGIAPDRYVLEHGDASVCLLTKGMLDYVDLDPFGSPVQFLDAACARLRRGGILAVGATDLAALSGVSPRACHRRYWAHPLRLPWHREMGLRILIRRVQLVAASHERAMVPVLVHAEKHYSRAYLRYAGGPSAIESVLSQHRRVGWCAACEQSWITDDATAVCPSCTASSTTGGPMWTGPLWDQALLERMAAQKRVDGRLLGMLRDEAAAGASGFYDLDRAGHRLAIDLPPTADLVARLREAGYTASRTHFTPRGLRTSAPPQVLHEALRRG
jgi:tRNA (guanine26-N2/guanine27-N2)-dimethyltransferase